MKPKEFVTRFLIAFMDSIRPFLGPRGVCIYHPNTCRKYARAMLQQKPLYIALPSIFLRLLSCNPITAWYWRIRKK